MKTQEVFRYEKIPDPEPAPDGVLVRVEAISIEGGDTLHRASGEVTGGPHVVGYLQRETGSALRRGMHYPATWDPFFADYMILAAIYRYPTQHFRFHQRQLTLSAPGE